jgi:hypothetical protein
MKRKLVFASISLVIGTIITDSYGNKAVAAGNFFCSSYSGAPATMKSTASGKNVPVILWKSNAFATDGWTPEKRCQEVSQRFSQLHQSGRLRYLTTGRMNGVPVICAAISEGSGCAEGGLLYTLKPGQNAGETLRNLLAIRVKATGPLTESTARPYISIEQIEQAASTEESVTSNQAQADSTNAQSAKKDAKQVFQTNSRDGLW